MGSEAKKSQNLNFPASSQWTEGSFAQSNYYAKPMKPNSVASDTHNVGSEFMMLTKHLTFCMSFDELDRTTRYIHEAKARAHAVLHEKAPKLTTLEKAMWVKLKRGEGPSR